MSLTDTRLISVRTDITPRDGFVGSVEDLKDTQVRLSPEVLFFARQSVIDERNEDVDFQQIERLLGGVTRTRFSLLEDDSVNSDVLIGPPREADGTPVFVSDLIDSILDSDVADDFVEAVEENAVVKGEDGEPLTDDVSRRAAIERAIGVSEDKLEDLNSFLTYFDDPQMVGKGLKDGSIPLTAQSLISNLPKNLTDEKRNALEKDAANAIVSLNEISITQDNFSNLHLETYERGSFGLNTMTIKGRDISSDDSLRGAMRILKQPALLNEAFATYLPRIMFFMMPFAMVLGILFVRGRKNALMYDHLVHAAYIHAFTYLYLLFIIILSQWTSITGLWTAFLWGMIIYLPISAKNMFQRGWFKTIWMTYNIAFSYSLTIFFIMIFLLATQLDKAVSAI